MLTNGDKKRGMTPAEIKAALLLRGISQAEIAEVIGCSRDLVSHVINGRRTTRRIREAVAKALGRDVEAIWPDEIYRRASGRIVKRAGFKL